MALFKKKKKKDDEPDVGFDEGLGKKRRAAFLEGKNSRKK